MIVNLKLSAKFYFTKKHFVNEYFGFYSLFVNELFM